MTEYKKGTKVFNDWIIVKELGEGANGKVFEIHKTDYGITTKSALKVIRVPKSVSDIKAALSEGMDEASVSSYFQGFVGEIVKEILVMSNLKGHPNIVGYEDHQVVAHEGSLGWDILIRMELLTSLVDYRLQRPLSERDVLRMGKELCSALEYCQRQGMIHRDIKPENIFVSRTGQFKLGDFGVARTVEKTTGGLSKKGTEQYMAPEVYLNRPYGASVDIYSLGLVLYSFLNQGRLPFYPPMPALITFADRENALGRRMNGEPIPKPQAENERFAEIIQKACAFDSKERYHTAAEMLAALKQADSTADARTVVKDKEVEKKTAVEEFVEEEKTVGTEIPTPEEEKTVGMEIPVSQEEKTIGMEIPVPQEEKTMGMEIPVSQEEKTIGTEIPTPEEEKTVGMEIPVSQEEEKTIGMEIPTPEEEKTVGTEIPTPQEKTEDTEQKEPCRGKDIHLKKVIDVETARNGGTVKVYAGEKDEELRIPKGVMDQTILRLKGKGERGLNGGSNGDLYVTIVIRSIKEQQKRQKRWRYLLAAIGIVLACIGSFYLWDRYKAHVAFTEDYIGAIPARKQNISWYIGEEDAYLEQWIPFFDAWNAWDGGIGDANYYTDSLEQLEPIVKVMENDQKYITLGGYEGDYISWHNKDSQEGYITNRKIRGDETWDRYVECGIYGYSNNGIGYDEYSIDLTDVAAVETARQTLEKIMPPELQQLTPGTKIPMSYEWQGEYDAIHHIYAEVPGGEASIRKWREDARAVDIGFEYQTEDKMWSATLVVDKATSIITYIDFEFTVLAPQEDSSN